MSHPSFLQLDRHALGLASPQTVQHLAGCAQCAAHVAKVAQPAVLPPDLEAQVRPRPFWRPQLAWLLAPAAVLATLLLVLPMAGEDVRTKGAPALAVFVRHAEKVTRWDGKSALLPGDAIRLEVAPSGFAHVTVVQPAGAVLFEAALDGEMTTLLAPSWTLDAAPGPERLTVVFSQVALTSEQLSALASAPRTEVLWTVPLVLPKETSR